MVVYALNKPNHLYGTTTNTRSSTALSSTTKVNNSQGQILPRSNNTTVNYPHLKDFPRSITTKVKYHKGQVPARSSISMVNYSQGEGRAALTPRSTVYGACAVIASTDESSHTTVRPVHKTTHKTLGVRAGKKQVTG